MSGFELLILFLGAAGILLAAFVYLRGEDRVRVRPLLMSLRVGVLGIVLLLLLDVRLPGVDPEARGSEGAHWILIDPDLSLIVPGAGEGTLWDAALARAEEEVQRGARLALATPGTGGPEGTDLSGLARREPDHPPGALVEGVLRLAEGGAGSVTILSSLRRTPDVLETLARESPIPVRLERLGEPVRNAGIAELGFPATAPTGTELEGRLSIFGEEGLPGDSVDAAIRVNGEVVQTFRLALPGPGEEASAPVVLPALDDPQLIRVTAHIALEGDPFPPDDTRARWIRVGEADLGILLVSLRPDWEPRVLLPLLSAVTGMEGEGYLALGEDRYLPLGEGSEVPRPVSSGEFQDRIPEARMLVVHGAGEEVPVWLQDAVRDHPRVLHLPADGAGAALSGVTVTGTAEGEWTVDPDPPSSPLSPFFSGIRLGGLPPLSGILRVSGDLEPVVGLRTLGPQGGTPVPVVHLLPTHRGRSVVVTAQGFWRWGNRDGDAREAYRALWAGVSAWMLGHQELLAGEGVRPVGGVQPRGEPLRWEVAPEAREAELVLTLLPDPEGFPGSAGFEPPGPPVLRAPLMPAADGIATTAPLPPGIYRFQVLRPDPEGGEPEPLAPGWVEVEGWAPSLRIPPLDPDEPVLESLATAGRPGHGTGRPLRTHPLPYVLGLLFLSAEWIGRRRAGLR